MKKTILILIVCLLLIGVNIYAQGNLSVSGLLDVGDKSLINVNTTSGFGENALLVAHVNSGTSTSFTGSKYQVNTDGEAINIASSIALDASILYRGSTLASPVGVSMRGVTNVLEFNTNATGNFHNLATVEGNVATFKRGSGNSNNINVAEMYGFHTSSVQAGSGTITADKLYHILLEDPGNAFAATTQAGIWIEQMTVGATDYGIVLAGTGSGSDIAFGPNQEARIYSAVETEGNLAPVGLWAQDSLGNSTQISPHDPETGEWIYYSKNIKTGRTVRVNMEKLVKAVEELTGETFMVETLIKD